MTFSERYDKQIVGIISGFLFPLIVGLIIFLFSSGNDNMAGYIHKIINADIITHAISLCVFPNVFIFLVFNRFDMLLAARGILGITIFWAVIVFAEKIF